MRPMGKIGELNQRKGTTPMPNNPYQKQASTYKQREIETASSEEILIMLYDGAIRFLIVAKKAWEDKNIEKFHNNIVKAQHIITEFMSSLDMEIGGDMAKNLFKLYEYLHYRLVQANMKKDVEMIDEVLEHLRDLKSTWEEAIKIAQQEQRAEKKDAIKDDEEQPAAIRG